MRTHMGVYFSFPFSYGDGTPPMDSTRLPARNLTLLINALAHLSSAAPREPWADLAVQSFYGVNGSMGNQWELRIEFPTQMTIW